MPFNPMYPSIQALISAHSDLAGHNVQAAVYWGGQLNWQSATNSIFPVTGNMTLFDMTTGNEEIFKSLTAINFPGGSGPIPSPPVGFDNAGFIYLADGRTGVHQVYGNNLNQRLLGGPSFNGAGYVFGVTNLIGQNFVVCTGPGRILLGFQTIDCLRVNDLSTLFPTVNYNNSIAVGTPGNFGSGIAYVVSSDANGSVIVTGNNARFFRIDTNLGTCVQTGTIRPTDIDPTWNIIGVEGCCTDQTDGLMLIVFDTGEAVTHQKYLCKLDPGDGSIVWKLALDNNAAVNSQLLYSDIQFQILCILVEVGGGNPNQAVIIDTQFGKVITTLTTGLSGFSFGNTGAWSDTAGSMVINLVDFGTLQVPNMPQLLNTTPSTFHGWAKLNLALPQAKSKIPPIGALIPLPDPKYIEPPGKFYPWGK